MASLPKYTAEENIRRIMMEGGSKFILVEGEDDMHLYEASLKMMLVGREGVVEFIPVFGGGKTKIVDFVLHTAQQNFIAILDRDFDDAIPINDHRVIYLDKYSIENYFFTEEVTSLVCARLLKIATEDVADVASIQEWRDHLQTNCFELLKCLYYYQNHYAGPKVEWSGVFLHRAGADSWEVDNQVIDNLLNTIFGGTIPSEEIEVAFLASKIVDEPICNAFPGKLLKTSMYRYIGKKIRAIRKSVFNRNFTNADAFFDSAAVYLCLNANFCNILSPAISFLTHE